MNFKTIVEDIRNLKIQGAQNIAKASIKALQIVAYNIRNEKKLYQIHNLNKAKQILFKTRPTEPAMRNTLNYVLSNIELTDYIYAEIIKRIKEVNQHFDIIKKKIAQIGNKKIKNKMVVFTHCHSSTVIEILKQAKAHQKRFIVHNTETRPKFQGRLTAKELARVGIPVVHYVDSAARLALKKADIMLLGADAITSEGKVINKIGSELMAEVAEKWDVPIYICTDSWKFDPKSVFGFEETIEKRSSKEIWPTAPKGVLINNFAFEKIDPNLITGIISELGIYTPTVFVEEVKRAYPWMF
ncbi:translation initiation factor eIF-2B [Candidatus Woesearchaeota archaeon]|nr:translation initiation factor eIF-2B [Candidatus Woesearchaeota archaeon]